jgi:hypothetical protein
MSYKYFIVRGQIRKKCEDTGVFALHLCVRHFTGHTATVHGHVYIMFPVYSKSSVCKIRVNIASDFGLHFLCMTNL